MDNPHNVITWFEIPAHDLDRAVAFYETVLDQRMHRETMGGSPYAFFSHESGVGGGIAQHNGFEPSSNGVMVYLNAGDDLIPVLNRVEEAGGSVEMGKTLIAQDIGYMAIIRDTEGNRLALHSRN